MRTMTPQARAIASLVLAVALLAGYLDRLGFTIISTFDVFVDTTQQAVSVMIYLVSALSGVLIFRFAGQAATDTTEPVDRSLAQAARLVAAIGILIAALGFLGAIADSSYGFRTYLG